MRAAGHFQVAGADVNATPSQTSAPQPPPTGNIFVGVHVWRRYCSENKNRSIDNKYWCIETNEPRRDTKHMSESGAWKKKNMEIFHVIN